MRMKRKKNLDERIAASSDYLITMKNDSLDFQDAIKENHLLDFNKGAACIFGNRLRQGSIRQHVCTSKSRQKHSLR